MKKINNVLCIVTAMLLFMVSFMSFDYRMFSIAISPFYDAQVDGNYWQIELGAYTKAYRHGEERFIEDLKTLYASIPYDGFVKSRQTTRLNKDNANTRTTLYISNKNKHGFSHLGLSGDPAIIDFNDATKHDYISNDVADEKATIHILPFNKFRPKVRDDLAKDRILYRPIHDFDLGHDVHDNNIFVELFFLVPKTDAESFKNDLKSQYILPNYYCGQGAYENEIHFCNMSLTTRDDYKSFSFENTFNLLGDPLRYPNTLVFLTAFCLFLAMLHLSFKESKEISIRRLYGNKESTIYARVFMRTLVMSVAVFITTLVTLAILVLDFNVSVTGTYLGALKEIVCYYMLGVLLTAGIYYGLLKIASKIHALKKPMNARVSLYLIFALKVMAVFTLSIPLITAYEKANRAKQFMDHLHQNPRLKEGYVVSDVDYIQSRGGGSIPDNNRLNLNNQAEADAWLFALTEKYGLEFMNEETILTFFMPEFGVVRLPYVAVNRNVLKNNDIYDLNHKRIEGETLKKNTLFIPQHYQAVHRDMAYFDNADVVFVEKTFNVAAMSDYPPPIESPPILVVVDNPDYYVQGINAGSIRLPNDPNIVDAFQKEVSQHISAPILIKNDDLYQFAISNYQDGKNEFGVLASSSLLLISLYSVMMLVSFIESRHKLLAIQYIHGIRRIRRYETIIYLVYVSVALICVCVYNGSRYEHPPLLVSSVVWYSGILLVMETILLVVSIRRFEKQSTSNVLKGDA